MSSRSDVHVGRTRPPILFVTLLSGVTPVSGEWVGGILAAFPFLRGRLGLHAWPHRSDSKDTLNHLFTAFSATLDGKQSQRLRLGASIDNSACNHGFCNLLCLDVVRT